MRKLFLTVLSLAALLSACSDTNIGPENALESSLEITTGITCGLCVGYCMDTLTIRNNRAELKEIAYVQPLGDRISRRTMSGDEWNDLLSAYDEQAFLALDLESCARCVDGCDYWLRIKTSNYDHQISYGDVDKVPPAVAELMEKLNEIRLSLQP